MTIDFESDPLGTVANGFVSADAPGVSFFAPPTIGLRIYSGVETDGNSLLLESDDDAGLRILFDFPIYALSLDFGNDDPDWHPSPDWALLTLLDNGTEIAQVSLQANHDDLMNQTIAYTGFAFNEAIFRYVDPQFNGIGLAEVIDNISFQTQSAIPTPSSIALLGLAVGLSAFRGVRKR